MMNFCRNPKERSKTSSLKVHFFHCCSHSTVRLFIPAENYVFETNRGRTGVGRQRGFFGQVSDLCRPSSLSLCCWNWIVVSLALHSPTSSSPSRETLLLSTHTSTPCIHTSIHPPICPYASVLWCFVRGCEPGAFVPGLFKVSKFRLLATNWFPKRKRRKSTILP